MKNRATNSLKKNQIFPPTENDLVFLWQEKFPAGSDGDLIELSFACSDHTKRRDSDENQTPSSRAV